MCLVFLYVGLHCVNHTKTTNLLGHPKIEQRQKQTAQEHMFWPQAKSVIPAPPPRWSPQPTSPTMSLSYVTLTPFKERDSKSELKTVGSFIL